MYIYVFIIKPRLHLSLIHFHFILRMNPVRGNASYEGRYPNYMTMIERRNNHFDTLDMLEWDLFTETINLKPSPDLPVIDVSRRNLDIAHKFQSAAIPIFSTMRGRTLSMLASKLFQNSSDVLWFSPDTALTAIPDEPLNIDLVTNDTLPVPHSQPPPSYEEAISSSQGAQNSRIRITNIMPTDIPTDVLMTDLFCYEQPDTDITVTDPETSDRFVTDIFNNLDVVE